MKKLLTSLLLFPLISVSAPIKSVVGAFENKFTESEVLPYDSEVEYLESTGMQYILLPDGDGSGIYLYIDFQIIPSGWNNPNFLTGLQSISYYSGAFPDNEPSNIFYAQGIFDYSQTTNKYERTTVVGIRSRVNALTGWALFARRQNNGTYAAGGCKRIFRAMFILGSKEINLIPVRIGDEGFLYDINSGELFGNVGTGTFVLGPDKE